MSIKQLNRRGRSGAILFVVVACLALFLSLGIAFVFYCNQQAISMRWQRESSNGGRGPYIETSNNRGYSDEAPPLATDLFNMGLGQLIYDVNDPNPPTATSPTNYQCSAMYGHSLARAIYGYNSVSPQINNVPYNGWGRIHNTSGTDQLQSDQLCLSRQRFPTLSRI